MLPGLSIMPGAESSEHELPKRPGHAGPPAMPQHKWPGPPQQAAQQQMGQTTAPPQQAAQPHMGSTAAPLQQGAFQPRTWLQHARVWPDLDLRRQRALHPSPMPPLPPSPQAQAHAAPSATIPPSPHRQLHQLPLHAPLELHGQQREVADAHRELGGNAQEGEAEVDLREMGCRQAVVCGGGGGVAWRSGLVTPQEATGGQGLSLWAAWAAASSGQQAVRAQA